MTHSGFFDLGFLYLLEKLRCPVLNVLLQGFTYCGEELVFMVAALAVFWCRSKRDGYYLLTVGFTGTIVNQFLKLWYRIPRPWVKDPGFSVVPSARSGAGGYSFPSGHTQNAAGTFGGIARFTGRRWLRIVCIGLILVISFSRMYLGCHTLLDVSVSLGIAAVLVFAFYPVFRSLDAHPLRMYPVLGFMLALALGNLLFVKLYSFPADLDAENYHSGLKNAYTLLGALLALCAVYPLERRFVRFRTDARWFAQLLKVVLGLCGVLVVKEGLKALFSLCFGTALWPNAVHNFFMVVFAGLIWPLTFRFFSRLGRKGKPEPAEIQK